MICGYLKSPAPFVILAYAGIHSLQRVSLWIPAYAGMTGDSLRNSGPELAEGRPAALLSSSRMRGSILCSLFLWIPAYAGMTGESLRNPVPELVEGRPTCSRQPSLIVFLTLRTWRLCGKSSFLLPISVSFRG